MKIVLFCSAFNGLSQRTWIELRASGHDVTVHLSSDANPIEKVCRSLNPDLVICPFLKDRVPESVWGHYRTVIIHPGPMGDRGPSSLDWAITENAPRWGVTALQAVEEMDAGPIWASRTFDMPPEPPRKGALYNGSVTDAAIELVHEVVAKAADRDFTPTPLDYRRSDVTGSLRPMMTQADRAFSWDDRTEDILRRIRAADGSPGVRAALGGQELSVFDAHPGPRRQAQPGSVLGVRNGALLVATGDGSLWVGQARRRNPSGDPALKLPAATFVRDELRRMPTTLHDPDMPGFAIPDVSYHRVGNVGVVSFGFYNGAMSTVQCRRLTAAVRRAAAQDTSVLVLRGGETFSNGIDLNVIEAAQNPAAESWANINAIDDLCKTIITCTNQLVVTSIGGNAGAGGVMLALGADRICLRDSAVLNPHYLTMGLYGSEYWTYVLPRRVGEAEAVRLTDACLPIGANYALDIGLVDRVIAGDRAEFEDVVLNHAQSIAAGPGFERALRTKREQRERDEHRKPLEAYRHEELGQMSRDMFDNRSDFDGARRAFIFKQKPNQTPAHLVAA